MEDNADEIAAVCAMTLIVYCIITNNLNKIYSQTIIHDTNKK